jgi:regulatory protein
MYYDEDDNEYEQPPARRKPQQRKARKQPVPFDESTRESLTEAQINKFKNSLRNSAYYYLERGDKTRKELEDRMKRKVNIPPDLIPGILDELERDGYIDDARYAQNFIYSRTEYRKQGKSVIRMDLMRKGVDREIIDFALEGWDTEEEAERAQELIAKKIRTTRGMDRTKRNQQIIGMLARKGYGGNVFGLVSDAIREAEAEEKAAAEAEELARIEAGETDEPLPDYDFLRPRSYDKHKDPEEEEKSKPRWSSFRK